MSSTRFQLGLLALALVLEACPLPGNVRYRCELDGGCAVPNTECVAGYCEPIGDAGPCIPPEDASIDLCPRSAQCGFFDAGCGVMVDCGWACATGEECGVNAPLTCAMPSLCTDTWCWENPLPQGNSLYASWSLDRFHTWFAGANGTLVFWNGEHSALVPVPVDAGVRLLGVSGTSPNDFFVGGDRGLLLHWNGAWEAEGISGGFTGRVGPIVTVRDGRTFAIGSGGKIFRRAGQNPIPSRWSPDTFDTTPVGDFLGIVPTGPDTLLAGTGNGDLFTLTLPATTWKHEGQLGAPYGGFKALWQAEGIVLYAGAGDLYVRSSGPDGGAAWGHQTQISGSAEYRAIAGTSLSSIWLFGTEVRHFDGGIFRQSIDAGFPAEWYGPAQTPAPSFAYNTAVVNGDHIVAVGRFGVFGSGYADDPSTFRELSSGSRTNVWGLCGSGDQLYAACENYGDMRMLERKVTEPGVSWEKHETYLPGTSRLNGCFAQGDSVWAVSDTQRFAIRAPTGVWSAGDFGGNHSGEYHGGWGASPTGPWYFVSNRVGELIVTFDAGMQDDSFVVQPYAGGELFGIWGLSPRQAWAVGSGGTLVGLQDDGGWQVLPGPSADDMRAIHGTRLNGGGTMYVAAGGNGAVWSQAGSDGFDAGRVATSAGFRTVWTSPSGEAFIGGTTVDGTSGVTEGWLYSLGSGGWSRVMVPASSVEAVWGFWDGGTSLFVAGDNGVILRRR